jgi:hypothetical protein
VNDGFLYRASCWICADPRLVQVPHDHAVQRRKLSANLSVYRAASVVKTPSKSLDSFTKPRCREG